MKPTAFWQNFQLGSEQEIACNFIYDGLRNLHDMETLSQETEIFPMLYNLSVGLERLLKVSLVLLEFDDEVDVETFEKSLITHSHLDLMARIKAKRNLNLGTEHIALLGLLAQFYGNYRYDRFNLASVYDLSKEKKAFHAFLKRYLQIDVSEEMFSVGNSLKVRKFVGKVVKKIAKELYGIVQQEAAKKNIYTYEISSSSSKAAKILWGEEGVLFEDEEIAAVELLLFLMTTKESPLVNALRELEPLKLDPALATDYLQVLLKKRTSETSSVLEEIEARYEELESPGERFKMISLLKSAGAWFGFAEDD